MVSQKQHKTTLETLFDMKSKTFRIFIDQNW